MLFDIFCPIFINKHLGNNNNGLSISRKNVHFYFYAVQSMLLLVKECSLVIKTDSAQRSSNKCKN